MHIALSIFRWFFTALLYTGGLVMLVNSNNTIGPLAYLELATGIYVTYIGYNFNISIGKALRE